MFFYLIPIIRFHAQNILTSKYNVLTPLLMDCLMLNVPIAAFEKPPPQKKLVYLSQVRLSVTVP